MKYSFLFLFLTVSTITLAQDSLKICKGRILAQTAHLEGIHVINLQTKRGTTTDERGNFSLFARENDTLLFSAVHLQGVEKIVEAIHLQDEILLVKMELIISQLNEVVLQSYSQINAYDLGIVSQKPKNYLPAERKYKTATDYVAQIGLSTSFSADPLLNLLSGRSAMLKKEMEVERKENLIEKIKYLFDDTFLVKKLIIPLEYLNAFRFYIVEDSKFVRTLLANNTTLATFLIGELAEEYKKILHE